MVLSLSDLVRLAKKERYQGQLTDILKELRASGFRVFGFTVARNMNSRMFMGGPPESLCRPFISCGFRVFS